MPKYECDGCGREQEIPDEAWPQGNTVAEVHEWLDTHEPPPMCSCPNHWGWMQVGGQAWTDYHDKGIHPMEELITAGRDLLKKHHETN